MLYNTIAGLCPLHYAKNSVSISETPRQVSIRYKEMDAQITLLSPQPHRHVPVPCAVRTNLLQAFLDLSASELQSQWPADPTQEVGSKQRVRVPERRAINPLVYDQAFRAVSEVEAFPWDVVAS